MTEQTFHSDHEQDEAARFFLPDVEPEAAVGWPERGYGSDIGTYDDMDDQSFYMLEQADFEGGNFPYERDLIDLLDIQDSLLADYGPTHTFDVNDWEE